jgi:hypothetical protein
MLRDKDLEYIPKRATCIQTAQKRYTTTERELLSAIETCKEYKKILLGYHEPIKVFTAHKNNTFNPNVYCLDLCLAQPHYSIQHIEGYDILCYKEQGKAKVTGL